MLTSNGVDLKMEFVYENYPRLGDFQREQGLLVDSKENVATNKITAVQGRKAEKDFFDLFYLLKDFDLKKLNENAAKKVVPLNYEGMLLALQGDTNEGDVVTAQSVDFDEYKTFVEQLKKDLLEYARHS